MAFPPTMNVSGGIKPAAFKIMESRLAGAKNNKKMKTSPVGKKQYAKVNQNG